MSNRFKPKFNIKKGDNVVVITGDDKDPKRPGKSWKYTLTRQKCSLKG